MPFIRVDQPSQALGLLKQYLINSNIECDCFYLNIDLCSKIGVDQYNAIDPGYACGIASNWCFSRCVFDNYDDNIDDNLSLYFAEFNMDSDYMLKLRDVCEEFIEEESMKKKWEDYDVFGFTSTWMQTIASFALGKKLKQIFPNKKVVYGGPSMYDEAAIEYMSKMDWIDEIFVGEADLSFPAYVKSLQDNESYDNIKGIVTRKDNEILYQDDIHTIDMNIAPIPDYSDYFNQVKQSSFKDRIEMEFTGIPLEFSRGCYYGNKKCCTFCADVELAKRQYKPRDPKNAIKYLLDASDKYPYAKKFWMSDPIMPAGYVKNILLPWSDNKKNDITLFLETKPWFDRNDAKIMADAGVDSVQMGIETLHPKTNDLLRKGDTLLKNVACLKWMELYGVEVAWNYLWRIPGEKVEWYEETLTLLKKIRHLPPPSCFAPVYVTKKTPYWSERNEFNFKNLEPLCLYNSLYSKDIDISKVAWYFEYDDKHTRYVGNQKSMLFNFPIQHKMVRQEINSWTEYKVDNSVILKLEGNIVIDSRGINYSEHSITETERELLIFCDSPQIKRKISSQFGDCELELNNLLKRDLIIEHENKYLSLVLIKDEDMPKDNSESVVKIELNVLHNAL